MRDKLLCWFYDHILKIPEGLIVPLPGRVLFAILHPIKSLRYWRNGLYDWGRCAYVLDGVTIGYRTIWLWGKGPIPSEWFRVVERDNGLLTIEMKRGD